MQQGVNRLDGAIGKSSFQEGDNPAPLFLNALCQHPETKRDWGYAREYLEGMWRLLQQPAGDYYVLGMNETHTVQELCEVAFGHVGLDWREHVKYDARYERPAKVDLQIGNPAQAKLDWEPKMPFKKLVRLVVESDLALLEGTPMHLVDSNISSPKHLDVLAEVPLSLVDGNATSHQAIHRA